MKATSSKDPSLAALYNWVPNSLLVFDDTNHNQKKTNKLIIAKAWEANPIDLRAKTPSVDEFDHCKGNLIGEDKKQESGSILTLLEKKNSYGNTIKFSSKNLMLGERISRHYGALS